MSLTECPYCGKGHICHVDEVDWEQRYHDLRDAVLALTGEFQQTTPDGYGQWRIKPSAIREAVERAERGE